MKFGTAILLLALAAPSAHAFAPSKWSHSSSTTSIWMGQDTTTNDLSVPYDAAARLEYDAWRKKYNKGDFDGNRYQIFKANYEAITVANVKAKKEAREKGEETPSLLSLNEFGDYSEDEYMKAQSMSTSDVMGKVVEAAESQNKASSALRDAADALAEEEEELAKKLGLNSVDELEVALDSMEGIASDGGELDQENLSREARIRSAYLDWCKEYSKEPDEARYRVFAENYLIMEKYASDTGKEMQLNQYADCTAEEYKALQGKTKPTTEKEAPKTSSKDAGKEDPRVAEARAKFEQIEAEEKRAAAAKRADEEIRKRREELRAWQEKSSEERRQSIEKERAERQKQQEQELAKLKQQREAEAIAEAKAEAEKDAKRAAEIKKLELQADEEVRRKAREWEERQRRLTTSQQKKVASKPSTRGGLDLGALFSSAPSKKPKMDSPRVNAEIDLSSIIPTPAPTAKGKKPAVDFGSFFSALQSKSSPSKSESKSTFDMGSLLSSPKLETKAPARKPVERKEKKAPINLSSIFAAPKSDSTKSQASPSAKGVEKKVEKPVLDFGSIFSSVKPAPVTTTPTPKPTAQVEVKPALDFGSLFGSPKSTQKAETKPMKVEKRKEIDISDPVTEAFTSFFGSSQKSAPPQQKVAEPTPAPARPSFSLFPSSSTSEKPNVKVPNKSGTLNLFGGGATEKKVEKKKSPVKIPNTGGTISLFGYGNQMPQKKQTITPPQKAQSSPVGGRPTLSIFGGGPQAKKTVTEPPRDSTKPKTAFSLFGGAKAATGSTSTTNTTNNIPILSRWKQNSDGSVTGYISNSKSFRNGTEITTSPVKGVLKKGSVVKTSSGSQYRLN